MSPYEFSNVLVALDGSEGAAKALDCALSICSAVGARLTALAVEGKLPAYAASLGEVDDVKPRRTGASATCSRARRSRLAPGASSW